MGSFFRFYLRMSKKSSTFAAQSFVKRQKNKFTFAKSS